MTHPSGQPTESSTANAAASRVSGWTNFRASPIGKKVIRVVRRSIDGGIERFLHIDTSARCDEPGPGAGHFQDSVQYEPLDYPLLTTCLAALRLRPDDVVFDVGCGMGRVLSLAARQKVKQCVGIELSPELAARARQNLASLRGRRAPAEVIQADAAFADYSQATALFIFNSFGLATMTAVLKQIHSTLAGHPRKVRIVYVNPFHDDALRSSGWLTCTRNISSPLWRMRASCWESKLPGGA